MPTGITKDLLTGLGKRNVPVAAFSEVAALEGIRGASKTKLNEYFRDAARMPSETEQKLWALWEEIETMALEVLPLAPWAAMDLSSGTRIHASLQIFRAFQGGVETLRGDDINSSNPEMANGSSEQ